MAQILDPLAQEHAPIAILCCYINQTAKVQIARITNVENWYFERVVFPNQRLTFEAPATAQLEIHTGMMASAIMSDSIACSKLEIGEADGAVSSAAEAPSEAVEMVAASEEAGASQAA